MFLNNINNVIINLILLICIILSWVLNIAFIVNVDCLCLGGMKCPQCEFVYGTKWELNRHLKSKHNMKVVEGSWEVNTHKFDATGVQQWKAVD